MLAHTNSLGLARIVEVSDYRDELLCAADYGEAPHIVSALACCVSLANLKLHVGLLVVSGYSYK